MSGARRSASVSGDELGEIVDALLRASRVLVSVAVRSLGDTAEVTLPQYRALVVLAECGPQSAGVLADALGVHASTLTRMCDRLVAKLLVTCGTAPGNRREVELALTTRGKRIVRTVTQRRRDELRDIVARVPRAQRVAMVRALGVLSDAADQPPESAWLLGWAED